MSDAAPDRWSSAASSDVPFKLSPIQLPNPTNMTFRPRRGTRRTLSAVLVVWMVCSVAAGLAAWHAPSQPTIGLAAAIVALTALTWVVRAGTSVAQVSVNSGILDIRKGGQRTTFVLRDSYQLIDVVGRPGRPGWKVLFHRQDHPPFVIDGSLVEPREFMRVLRYYRPEL